MLWSHINLCSSSCVCSALSIVPTHIQVSLSRALQSLVVFVQTSPFDPLLYHVRSLLSLFLALLTTIYLHQSVAISSALALPSSPVRIISEPFLLPYVASSRDISPCTRKPLSRPSRPTSWRLAQTTSSYTRGTRTTEHLCPSGRITS